MSLARTSSPPGSVIANVGVYGIKVDLHLEKLWERNIAITTRLVDTVTTPMLLKTVQSRRIDPEQLITQQFKLTNIVEGYETSGAAAKTNALKVLIEAASRSRSQIHGPHQTRFPPGCDRYRAPPDRS